MGAYKMTNCNVDCPVRVRISEGSGIQRSDISGSEIPESSDLDLFGPRSQVRICKIIVRYHLSAVAASYANCHHTFIPADICIIT